MEEDKVGVLPDSIEEMAEYAISKVMSAGAGVAKNFMDYLQSLEEVRDGGYTVYMLRVSQGEGGQTTLLTLLIVITRLVFRLNISLYNLLI